MTGGATDGSGRRSTPLAPARTRPPAGPTTGRADLPLLPPVLSGLFARSTPETPAPMPQPAVPMPAAPVEAAPIESAFVDSAEPAADAMTTGLPLIADDQTDQPVDIVEAAVDWFTDDDSAPWEQAATLESTELILEIEDESGEFVPEGAAAAGDADDPALPAEAQEPETRPAPTPLSPWELGAANAGAEAEEHAARARAEWESMGQALTGSLSVDSPATQPRGAHEIELTDEIVASLEAQMGESYSPFIGLHPTVTHSGPPSGHLAGEGGGKRAALSDLARRLEAFAAQIRAEGPEALARAQREGDRVDALLAGIAAGFIAGRGE